MTNIITKNTSIADAKEILWAHGCPLSYGWEIVIGMMLQECDYIEIHGFGHRAYFSMGKKEGER